VFLPLLLLFVACKESYPVIENIPPDLGDGPWFTDVTQELGLGPDGLNIKAGGVATADVDGDHWPDLFLSQGSNGTRDDPSNPSYYVRLLRNQGGKGYEDVTFTSGITATRDGSLGRYTSFIGFADFDNDGDVDAWSGAYNGSGTPDSGDHSEILLNNGDGTFVLGPESYFSDDPRWDAVQSATTLDANLDGVLDLFVGHWYATYGDYTTCGQDDLFQGDGTGAFVDISEASGMFTRASWSTTEKADGVDSRPTWGVTACDTDGDGTAEIFTDTYGRGWNRMWDRQADGTWLDIGREMGFASDANEDFSDDMYYACHCHYYTDGSTCDPMPPEPMISCSSLGGDPWSEGWSDQPWSLGGNSSNTVCGDVDNDGDLDLLQIELRHWHIGQSSDMTELLLNDGAGVPWRRPGNEVTGLTRDVPRTDWNEGDLGGALFDFDNDGRLDPLVASSDYPDTWTLLWHQNDDGNFTNVTDQSGLSLIRGHGVTLVDYDRDGDYDVVQGTSLMRWSASDDPPAPDAVYAYVYRNEIGSKGNRLMIDLRGKGTGHANKSAIGARIVAKAGGDLYVREVTGMHGLGVQQNDPLQIIGTGSHAVLDSLEIHWPDAAQSVDTFEDVKANYVLEIRQGDDEIAYQTLEEYRGDE